MEEHQELARRMEGAVSAFKKDLSGLRTGRASTSLVEGVTVEAYGSPMPLEQVATINVPEPRMISLQVWDKSMVGAVEKAILNSGLGLNPATDGQLVRLPIPDLTEERRKELAKLASQYAEKGRIAVRNVRRDGIDQAKKQQKEGELSEDAMHDAMEEIQKLTDAKVAEIDTVLASKEQEILTV